MMIGMRESASDPTAFCLNVITTIRMLNAPIKAHIHAPTCWKIFVPLMFSDKK